MNDMNVETKIYLDRFQPRFYQLNLLNAIDKGHVRRAMAVWPRRSGKDVACWNLIIRAALRKVGVYFYCLPTFRQARLVIWDSITNDGRKFLDYIPKELIKKTNVQEMKIELINGSLISLIGSDSYDTALVGTNCRMIVFSEWSLSDERAYQFVRPILNANDGTAIFIMTPRGKNHAYSLYQIAKNNPETWFCELLTVTDTNHIPMQEIEKELASGELSDDLVQQEYYCSFDMGVEGSYYSKYLDRMRLKGQIGLVPHETGFKVLTAWDIGYRDSTSIIFYQICGQTIRVIDYYEKTKEGLEHYIKVINQKADQLGYVYGKHFAPHDIAVTEFGSGLSRVEKAQQLGLKFEFRTTKEGQRQSVLPNLSIEDGIEAVRSAFSKIWIDETNCKQLINCLENYRQEYDIKRKVYKDNPLHNYASHGADAFRYMVLSLPKTRDGLTAQELDARYQNAMYGNNNKLPAFFRDDI